MQRKCCRILLKKLMYKLLAILADQLQQGRPCVIKDDATLQREKTRLLDHAIQLVAQKYGVTVPVDDVVACHRLKNSILLKIWRRTKDSAWSKLMSQIKSASTNDFNLYANFQMTPRRGALLYHICQLRSTFANKGCNLSNFIRTKTVPLVSDLPKGLKS